MTSSHHRILRSHLAHVSVFCTLLCPLSLHAQTWNCTIVYAGKTMRNDVNVHIDAASIVMAKHRALAAAPPHGNAAARIALCQRTLHDMDTGLMSALLY